MMLPLLHRLHIFVISHNGFRCFSLLHLKKLMASGVCKCQQSCWGADNSWSPCWITQAQSVCFAVCMCMLPADQPRGPKGWSSFIQRQTEDGWRAILACHLHRYSHILHSCSAILFHLTTLGSLCQTILRLLSFEVFVLLFAEESNWEDCNCTIFLRLSSCNFHFNKLSVRISETIY